MAHTAKFTIRLGLPDGADPHDSRIQEALDNLLSVMLVQAEDGLFYGGHEDAEIEGEENDFFGPFTPYTGSLREQSADIIIDPNA